MRTHPFRLQREQRQHVLKLIAEAVRTARLVKARSRAHAAGKRLMRQPAVHHSIQLFLRRLNEKPAHAHLPFDKNVVARGFVIGICHKRPRSRSRPIGALRPADHPVRPNRRILLHQYRNFYAPSARSRRGFADSVRIQNAAASEKRISPASGIRPRIRTRKTANARHCAARETRAAPRPRAQRARILNLRAHQPVYESNQPHAALNRAANRRVNAHLRRIFQNQHRNFAGKPFRFKSIYAFIRRLQAFKFGKRFLARQQRREFARFFIIEIQHPAPAVVQ